MELIQQPEIKDAYDKCKYRVKLWEYEFKKKNGRLPSKLDIREANKEVRLAYKTYFNLKSAALEQSFRDVEGFHSDEDLCSVEVCTETNCCITGDEKAQENVGISNESVENNINGCGTWGEHLSNKKQFIEAEMKRKKSTINSSLSQKLFGGSKFSKRNPRKSLSFHHRKSDTNINLSKSFSQASQSFSLTGSESREASLLAESSNQMDFVQNVPLKYLLNIDSGKVISENSHGNMQPLNVIQSVLNNEYKPRQTLNSGWIDRVTQQNASAVNEENVNVNNFLCSQEYLKQSAQERTTKFDYDSDDVIDNSDEDAELSQSVLHIAKKLRANSQHVVDITYNCDSANQNDLKHKDVKKTDEIDTRNQDKRLDFTNILENSHTNNAKNFESNVEKMVDLGRENLKNTENNLSNTFKMGKVADKEGKNERAQKPKAGTIKSKTKIERNFSNYTPSQRSVRPRKVTNLKEDSDSENDTYTSETDSKDSEFKLYTQNSVYNFDLNEEISEISQEKEKKHTESAKKKPTSGSRRKGKINKESHNEDNNESSPYELEYSVNPRIVTVPRISRVKRLTKPSKTKPHEQTGEKNEAEDGKPIKEKQQWAKDKLEKKMASGNLNENFVRINLKKKVFVRGKKTLNYGKYKKQLWKNKKKALAGPDMDMGGCDGGLLTCFSCGQVGHFARHCQNAKGDNLLPLSEVEAEEDCPHLTLEDVAKVACASSLAIRQSNIKGMNTSVSENDRDETVSSKESHSCFKAALDTAENIVQDSEQPKTTDAAEAEAPIDWENHKAFDDSDNEDLLAETLKLENYFAKLDMKQYMDSTRTIRPYYENEMVASAPEEVLEALRKFGHERFRPGQERAVMRILSGKSTLVTLSTGSGKSLCYQLPAHLYSQRERCLSLVISPLVSLMEDQVTGIPAFLKAACLHTNQTKTQRHKIMDAISSGDLNILLVSPEAVVAGERSSGFGSLLRKLPPIAFACIDEAHCVSQWSHNFRPSYLMICRILRESLGVTTILGLTATATRSTGDSIIRHLQIPDGRDGVISDVPLPDNLRLTVSKDIHRDQALLGLLVSERFVKYKSIIVYCTRRDECERVATFLRTSLKGEHCVDNSASKKRKRINVQAEPYHAGMSATRRKTIQRAFMSGALRIVVATVAFGMGINKSDIRAVIHYNMPSSFESYVQEVGRAGRDGLPAHCHLFLDSQGRDENELRRHVHANSMDRHVIRKLLRKIFVPCECKVWCPKHEVAFYVQETVLSLDLPEENISTLLCYLELHDNRYIQVLSPAYTTCKVISYGGPLQIRKQAKDCPPLAMALALYKKTAGEGNVFEFPVIDVASAMGWDSGICKHKLKNLEWTSENNQPKRSSLSVQFLNLGFRLLAPGNLSDAQLDDALDSLCQRVVDQEKTRLLQLHALNTAVSSVAAATYRKCVSDESSKEENALKMKIREYFNSPNPLEMLTNSESKPVNEDSIVKDTNALVCMYRDNIFTGRAVARIFHGIQSPIYPAVIWGRCKFWRSHMHEDFNTVCKIATREILKMRC